MEERVMEICRKHCKGTISDCRENLFESGLLSSYGLLELLCELETAFSIDFLPEEINHSDNFATVEAIAACIQDKLSDEKA